jgi:hypothetical protein
MKAQVNVNQRCDIAISGSALSGRHQRPTATRQVSPRFGGGTGCRQPIQGCPNPVAINQVFALQRCDPNASPRLGVLDETLSAQQHQCLKNRLPRYAQPIGQLLLGKALAGREITGHNRVQQSLVHAFGQIGRWRDLSKHGYPGIQGQRSSGWQTI